MENTSVKAGFYFEVLNEINSDLFKASNSTSNTSLP